MRGTDRPEERGKLEDSTAARLAEIVAAAESAAKKVIDDAEEQTKMVTSLSNAARAKQPSRQSSCLTK